MTNFLKNLIFLLLISSGLKAQQGTLDPTFSTDGKVKFSLDGFLSTGRSVMVQPDQMILIGGSNDFSVARLKTDGTFDSTFNDDGGVNYDVYGQAYCMALQPDGKILLGGWTFSSPYGHEDVMILRLNSNGSIDSAFGNNGFTMIDYDAIDEANAIALQSDGKIVFAGYSDADTPSGIVFLVGRFNNDGTVDSTFGSNGRVATNFGDGNEFATGVCIQPDGKIIATGFSGNGSQGEIVVMARYNSNGSLDTSFGAGGKTNVEGGYRAHGCALLPDGRLLVGCAINGDLGVIRCHPDGSLDIAFGIGGYAYTNCGNNEYEEQEAMALQPDGKIVVAGYTIAPFTDDFENPAIVRFTMDGLVDSSFGTNGHVVTDFGTSEDRFYGVAVQNDGKILAAGGTGFPDWNCIVARYTSELCYTLANFNYSVNDFNVAFTDLSNNATSWYWSFGDGNTSNDQNPLHTYTEAGTYQVCLTAADSCSGVKCQTIQICDPLTTSFDYILTAPKKVKFLSDFSNADDHLWIFGDGTTGQSPVPNHTYADYGTYTACLYEFNECDADTMCQTIILCPPITSNFITAVNGFTVQFTDSSENATQWHWNFGDGTTSDLQNPIHEYPLPGNYMVCLIASDTCSSDTLCQEVTAIDNSLCYAEFMLEPDAYQTGLYYGYNLSYGDNLIYNWSWGDGTYSTGQLPSHTYSDSGYYTICLMIQDTVSGCVDTFCADYQILKPDGMMGMHEIIFVDYAVESGQVAALPMQWRIYPNPANSVFYIVCSKDKIDQVRIRDVNGMILKSLVGYNQGPLNVSDVPGNVLIVEISVDDIWHSKLFIKQ